MAAEWLQAETGSECEQPGWPVLPPDSSRHPALDVWSPPRQILTAPSFQVLFPAPPSHVTMVPRPLGAQLRRGSLGWGVRVALGKSQVTGILGTSSAILIPPGTLPLQSLGALSSLCSSLALPDLLSPVEWIPLSWLLYRSTLSVLGPHLTSPV